MKRQTARKVFGVVYGALLFSGYFYFKIKTDGVRDEFERANEILHQCKRIQLRMTRDDVIQLLGRPLKEYNVRPQGAAGGVHFKELLYNMPLSNRPAYVDLELETSRVVEAFCNEDAHISMPFTAQSELRAEDKGPLPTDQAIPTATPR